jgi:tetratricopeptide (TPR) repeat protein
VSPVALPALLALTALLYVPALSGPFQLDDFLVVAADPGAQSLGAWWAGLGQHVRPMLKLSFVATHALGDTLGDVPLGHRIGNLGIHLLSVLLAVVLGRRLPRFLGASDVAADDAAARERTTHRVAFGAAVLLALHPLATEAVSYISGRSVSLAMLATLVMVLAYMHARDATAPAWARGGALAAALAAFAVAAGTREAAIAMPLILLLIERLRADPAPIRSARWLGLGVLGLTLGGALWVLARPRYAFLLDFSMRVVEARPGESPLATALAYWGCVLSLLCTPNIDPIPQPVSTLASLLVWSAVGAAITYCVMAARSGRSRAPAGTVLLAWALLWCVPLYALPIRLDPVAERHAYPLVWSVGWVLGWVLCAAGERARAASARPIWRRWAAGLALATMVAAAAMAAARNLDYRSEVALWEAAHRANPDKLRPLVNLGNAYIEAGRWDEASRVLERALALAPDEPRVQRNLDRAARRSPHE